jgi:hypothetical protein
MPYLAAVEFWTDLVVLYVDICIGVDCKEFSGSTYKIVLLSMFVIGVNRDRYRNFWCQRFDGSRQFLVSTFMIRVDIQNF